VVRSRAVTLWPQGFGSEDLYDHPRLGEGKVEGSGMRRMHSTHFPVHSFHSVLLVPTGGGLGPWKELTLGKSAPGFYCHEMKGGLCCHKALNHHIYISLLSREVWATGAESSRVGCLVRRLGA
jgi:hypothetical protein